VTVSHAGLLSVLVGTATSRGGGWGKENLKQAGYMRLKMRVGSEETT
jgi:hypothetical protein